jgi:hypothetical protein
VGQDPAHPAQGLAGGLEAKLRRPSGRMIPGLSSESATGRAIVLVPEALNADASIEVIVFLHGFTEGESRPHAELTARLGVSSYGKMLASTTVAPVRTATLLARAMASAEPGTRRRPR